MQERDTKTAGAGPGPDSGFAPWQRYLESIPPVLDLPVSGPRHPGEKHLPGVLTLTLPQPLRTSLGQLGAVTGCPGHYLVLAAFFLLIRRYSTQVDLLIGTDRGSLESGECARDIREEFLVLRMDASGFPDFLTWATRVRQAAETCLRLPRVTFARLARHMGLDNTTYHPVVQLGFFCLAGESDDPGARIDTGPLDLTLLLERDCSNFTLGYDQRLFRSEAVELLGGHLLRLLECACADPGRNVMTLDMLKAGELETLTREWNRTAIDFPRDRCLHDLFEAQVDARPEALAVVCGSQSLSYGELEDRSNRLAHHLRSLGVGPNGLAAISIERSTEMVVGLMGIAKAGGAYLPLDPSYPPERLGWMLSDARPRILLTLEHLAGKFADFDIEVVLLDADVHAILANSGKRPSGAASPEDLAYVIYTSGSTGKPKGVVLDHRGRVNNFSDFNRRFSVGPRDSLIALSSLSFDMTAYDVFGVLAAGATIVMPTADNEREPAQWADLIRRHHVTVWHSAPAMLDMLLQHVNEQPDLYPGSLRLCLLGGDWIPVSMPDRLCVVAGEVQVISLGGATEASMDSTIFEIENTDPSWASIPYGRPMANQLGYVLDPFNQPTPVGVPGELHLGGVGVGWGYLDRPGLTAEKFVPNPYSGVPGDRMYRTGDLARYFPDGNLELLGRMDYQVKIRGHRIELGEIESTIKEHPSIREAVVVAKGERGGDQRLVGYLIPDFDQGGTAAELQKHDREQVDNWQSVYDETYGQEIPEADSTFNIIGWNSSYTGLPIPAEEMREWVDSTVDRIRRLRPRRILEIGCGTGLLLFRLAPDCERYVGLDISRVGLQYVQRQLDQRGLAHVTLLHQAADDLAGVEPSSFDLVILNSITQLFPSVDYLLKVLGGALGAVSPGGHVFIGDNRNLRLGEALHASIQVAQAPASIPLSDLPGRIRKSFKQEEQLLLDPRFFEALAGKDQRITAATVEIKHGKHHNELTRYRYDVTLTVGSESYPSDPERLHWLDDSLSIETLRRSLGEKRTRDLLVSAIPNARLRSDRHALELIAGPEDLTDVGSLRSALQGSAPGGDLDPEDLWIIADEHGYVAVLGYSELAGDLSFDALFIPRDRYSTPPPMPARILSPARWAEYANQPLKSKLRLGLPPQLHRFLADRLPDYMVPATFVLLDKLPLTPNGKVDRKNLPEPDHARPELGAPMLEPRDALEKVLAQIWEEIIGVDRVGVLDSFLELGGHSLLATQIQSRIRALLSVEIPLRHFFGKLTVEKLAGDVRAAGQTAGVDVESAAEMVLHYGQLPVEDIQQLLERGPAQ